MRTPRRVRRMLQDRELVEDSIRDELLRRLSMLRDPDPASRPAAVSGRPR